MKDANGETRRDRNEAFETESPDPEIPENGSFLWDSYWDLRSSQPSGFSGPVPISNSELVAWLQVTGNVLRREEVAALKAMDSRYCVEVDRESEAIRQREQASN